MADVASYTRRFSQVFLKELDYIQTRRESLQGLDPMPARELQAQIRDAVASMPGEGGVEPPTGVLMATGGEDTETSAPWRTGESVDRGTLRGQLEAGTARGLVGLALSGGGIRSATFNLGLLQGLAKRGVLKCCDYLSTVSGGGYIGSCLDVPARQSGSVRRPGPVPVSIRPTGRS